MNEKLIEVLKDAYDWHLAFMPSKVRNTVEGQCTLSILRNAISQETGEDLQKVQEAAEDRSKRLRAQMSSMYGTQILNN